MSELASILVVDDELIMQEILGDFLREEGYGVDVAGSGEEGVELAQEHLYDCAIVDLMMPGIDGIETMQQLRKIDASLPVIMVTAFASVESAVEAMKQGAHEYITKPFKNDEVLVVLQNAIRNRQLEEEVKTLRKALKDKYRFENIVGKNRYMQEVYSLIEQAAPSRSTILIQGESGTGKELVAKAIHANSARSDKPFVVVNSGSMPSDLLESNLFGHVKGAFTGAVASKKGLFEVADGGSIFFDEIGSIGLDVQAKLLRVIQEKEFMRLGSVDTVKVDVRLIAATNDDLKRMIVAGTFREDLYYRINVISMTLPPLRNKADDIPLLAQYFLDKYGSENGRANLRISDDALELLKGHSWPGNVRELENAIERAVVLAPPDGDISGELIREYIEPMTFDPSMPLMTVPPEGLPMKDVVQEFQKQLIVDALRKTGWVQKEAARLLGVKPTTLNEMIKRHGIRESDLS
ncbi:MAG: sigma-54-dependent Fis family transcriptional regulator [Acidobacteria bacterium]|nr:sigma-54-dependent Fis family transcriptional regulator [Acidobacteriota bacterium]